MEEDGVLTPQWQKIRTVETFTGWRDQYHLKRIVNSIGDVWTFQICPHLSNSLFKDHNYTQVLWYQISRYDFPTQQKRIPFIGGYDLYYSVANDNMLVVVKSREGFCYSIEINPRGELIRERQVQEEELKPTLYQ